MGWRLGPVLAVLLRIPPLCCAASRVCFPSCGRGPSHGFQRERVRGRETPQVHTRPSLLVLSQSLEVVHGYKFYIGNHLPSLFLKSAFYRYVDSDVGGILYQSYSQIVTGDLAPSPYSQIWNLMWPLSLCFFLSLLCLSVFLLLCVSVCLFLPVSLSLSLSLSVSLCLCVCVLLGIWGKGTLVWRKISSSWRFFSSLFLESLLPHLPSFLGSHTCLVALSCCLLPIIIFFFIFFYFLGDFLTPAFRSFYSVAFLMCLLLFITFLKFFLIL